MPDIVALSVVIVFSVLSLIHVYWAFGGRAGSAGAVPELNGHPAFVPTARGTFAVSVVLAYAPCSLPQVPAKGSPCRPQRGLLGWPTASLLVCLRARSVIFGWWVSSSGFAARALRGSIAPSTPRSAWCWP